MLGFGCFGPQGICRESLTLWKEKRLESFGKTNLLLTHQDQIFHFWRWILRVSVAVNQGHMERNYYLSKTSGLDFHTAIYLSASFDLDWPNYLPQWSCVLFCTTCLGLLWGWPNTMIPLNSSFSLVMCVAFGVGCIGSHSPGVRQHYSWWGMNKYVYWPRYEIDDIPK